MKIGVLTSGGDCQGLNAALRGVAAALYAARPGKVELYGIEDGYLGLAEGRWSLLEPHTFGPILRWGGTILGTSRQPFKEMQKSGPDGRTRLDRIMEQYRRAGFDTLVILGGNGTHKTALLLAQQGARVVTLPKTIDNDIACTDRTFGFDSGVDKAAAYIDALHTTARSHGRVFVAELMGHKVGWIALYAGIAAGADVILLPEIPYHTAGVERAVKAAVTQKGYAVVAAAEGALSAQEAGLPKKQRKAVLSAQGAAERVAQALSPLIERDVRTAVPGHFQRGGEPTPADRLLCTRLGAAAAHMILDGKFGCMAGLQNNRIVPVPLEKVAGVLKTVPDDCEILAQARAVGISFGEE